jgi:hypothetical protein
MGKPRDSFGINGKVFRLSTYSPGQSSQGGRSFLFEKVTGSVVCGSACPADRETPPCI